MSVRHASPRIEKLAADQRQVTVMVFVAEESLKLASPWLASVTW
jgi:hypothetical protein